MAGPQFFFGLHRALNSVDGEQHNVVRDACYRAGERAFPEFYNFSRQRQLLRLLFPKLGRR